MVDSKDIVPEVEFIDADNYQGGDKNTLSFPAIVANQFSRVSIEASKAPTGDYDELPLAVMSLMSLLKPYLDAPANKKIVDEITRIEGKINDVKKRYDMSFNNLKKQSQRERIDYNIIQLDITELKINLFIELRELYLLLNSELVKLWKEESFFGSESGTN